MGRGGLGLTLHLPGYGAMRWCRGRAFASHSVDRGSIPGRDRPKSLKQEVTAPVPNRVTVGIAG